MAERDSIQPSDPKRCISIRRGIITWPMDTRLCILIPLEPRTRRSAGRRSGPIQAEVIIRPADFNPCIQIPQGMGMWLTEQTPYIPIPPEWRIQLPDMPHYFPIPPDKTTPHMETTH